MSSKVMPMVHGDTDPEENMGFMAGMSYPQGATPPSERVITGYAQGGKDVMPRGTEYHQDFHAVRDHEAQHGVFHKVAQIHGRDRADRLGKFLWDQLSPKEQKAVGALTSRSGYFKQDKGLEGGFHEEAIAQLQNYLQSPRNREGVHQDLLKPKSFFSDKEPLFSNFKLRHPTDNSIFSMHRMTPDELHATAKGAWKKLMTIAPKVKFHETKGFHIEDPTVAKAESNSNKQSTHLRNEQMAIFNKLKKEEAKVEPSKQDPPTLDRKAWVDHPILHPRKTGGHIYMISGDNPNYDLYGTPLKLDSTDSKGESIKIANPSASSVVTNNDDLAKYLANQKAKFEITQGMYNGIPERSIILYGLDPQKVDEIARHFGQESFVHIDATGEHPVGHMRYVNGSDKGQHNPQIPSGTQVFGQTPPNFYTTIPGTNQHVRFDFDWSTKHPNTPKCETCTSSQSQAQITGDDTMKKYSVEQVKEAIAGLIKKEMEAHEGFMSELHKADMEKKSPPGHEKQVEHIAESYEKKGKSAGQAKAIAAATAWKQHKEHGEHSKEASAPAEKAESCEKCGKAECECKKAECKKCGTMMKAGACAKCDMSDVKPEKSMSKSAVEEVASFLAFADRLVKAASDKDDKKLNTGNNKMQSFSDKAMGGKGPEGTGETEEVSEGSGSGGDVEKGKKLGKAAIPMVSPKAHGSAPKIPSAAHAPTKAGPVGTAAGTAMKTIPSVKNVNAKPVQKAVFNVKAEESHKKSEDVDLMIELVKAFDIK
jgi:hypothetical protein